jgi:hypothetical protein
MPRNEERTLTCVNCDMETNEQHSVLNSQGDTYCRACYDETYFHCYSCNEETHLDHSFYSNSTELTYCEYCYSEHFTNCCHCNAAIPNSDVYYDEEDEPFCRTCYRENCSIHNYSYRPEIRYYTSKAERTIGLGHRIRDYYGIETEVENKKEKMRNDEMAKSIENLGKGNLYCKEDGSLDYGFEVISQPFSWQYYKESQKNLFENVLQVLRQNGFSSFNARTCGIHIHISKRAFDTCHLYKFLKMFCEPEHYGFIRIVSQRTKSSSSGSCQWGKGKENECIPSQGIKSKAFSKDNNGVTGRYTAVNLENRSTVEIRIFRGTLNAKSFHKNVEFCKAMFEFTKNNSIKKMNVPSFLRYVQKYRKTYSNLYEFLKINQLKLDNESEKENYKSWKLV